MGQRNNFRPKLLRVAKDISKGNSEEAVQIGMGNPAFLKIQGNLALAPTETAFMRSKKALSAIGGKAAVW